MAGGMINPNVVFLNSFTDEVRYVLKQRSPMKYLAHRYRWNHYPQKGRVARFPDHVDIETCSHCQLACPMCFQTVRDDVKNGMMDFDLFRKIMREVAVEKPYSIRLSWRGECLLHPRFKDMLTYARSVYDGNISFLTNALKLDEEMMELLIDKQIDYIVISADGVGKTYEEVRKPGSFDGLVEKLTLLKKMKEKRGSKYPMVRINAVSLWLQGDEQAEFKRVFAPLTDKILIGGMLNNFKNFEVKHDPERTCSYPWQRLLIGWDGNVAPCCDDYLGLYPMGNVVEKSIMDIWHGPEAEHLRRVMSLKKRLNIDLCRTMDCGVDENDNEGSEEFLGLLKDQVERDLGSDSPLLNYICEGEAAKQ